MSEPSFLPADRTKVAILANPKAGTGKRARHVDQLVAALRHRKLNPILCWEREQFSEEMTRDDQWRCVVAAGGDGTLLEVVNRAPGKPISLLPLGNENLVAKYCGLIRSGPVLAETIADGKLYQTDLASLNGSLFSVMVGAGIDAEVVHRVHRNRRGHIGKQHYVVPTLQALSYYRYPTIEVEIDNGEVLKGSLVFVFNIPQYAMDLPIAMRAHPADGKLDVYVFERPGMFALGRYFWNVFRRRHLDLPDCHHRVTTQVSMRSEMPVPLQTDGDPAGALPATVEVLPQALTLVVPRQGAIQ